MPPQLTKSENLVEGIWPSLYGRSLVRKLEGCDYSDSGGLLEVKSKVLSRGQLAEMRSHPRDCRLAIVERDALLVFKLERIEVLKGNTTSGSHRIRLMQCPACGWVMNTAYTFRKTKGKGRWEKVGHHCSKCGSFSHDRTISLSEGLNTSGVTSGV